MRRRFGIDLGSVGTGASRAAAVLAALAASTLLAPGSIQAGKLPDVRAGLVYDDNVNRAEMDAEIQSDISAEAAASWSKLFQVAVGKTISLTGTLGAAKFDEFDGLDNFSLSVASAYRHKFGLGPTATWFRGGLSVAYEDYDVDVRDGMVYTAEAKVGKLLNDRWDLSGGLAHEARRAKDTIPAGPGGIIVGGPGPGPGPGGADLPGDTFDLDITSVMVSADFTATERLLLTFGVTYRDGDVASTAIPNTNIIDNAQAITDDPVFGPTGTFFAYKIDATVLSLAVDANIALNEKSSVVVGVENQATSGIAGIDYDKNIVRAHYLRTF